MNWDRLSEIDYFLAFVNFLETPVSGVALRIFLHGSKNETELLLGLPGTVDQWQVDFQSYAVYSATAEDFTSLPARPHIGNAYHIYAESSLLSYLKRHTNLTEQELTRHINYRHFSFACMEHQVDVVSADTPMIELLHASKDFI